MLKFSFPHFYYENLTDIIDWSGAKNNTDVTNVLRGERYKGYYADANQYAYFELQFDSVIQYDHWIWARPDLADLSSTPSWTDITFWYEIPGFGWSSSVYINYPYPYSDLYDKDVIYIKPDPTLYTSQKYRVLIDWRPDTTLNNFACANFQLSTFFEFDHNPSKWNYRTESNQNRFVTDLQTEISVELDYPKRSWVGVWENVSDAKLDTFKTRVQQQLTDNQFAYCYLYDSSGREELLGADLAHVRIEDFKYRKIQSNYNEIECKFVEVRG